MELPHLLLVHHLHSTNLMVSTLLSKLPPHQHLFLLHHSPTILQNLNPAPLLCHLLVSLILTLFAATALATVHVLGVLPAGSVQRGQVVTIFVTGVLVTGASGLRSTTHCKCDRLCERTFLDIFSKNP